MGALITGINLGSKGMERGTLFSAVEPLPSKAKVAMYRAASARQLAQRSWNRCAFNAAGVIVGDDNIQSVEAAALAFGTTTHAVSQFIQIWDSYSSLDPTADLMEAIKAVGIFTNPTDKIRVIDSEQQDAFLEEMEGEFELEPLDVETSKLLFASAY